MKSTYLDINSTEEQSTIDHVEGRLFILDCLSSIDNDIINSHKVSEQHVDVLPYVSIHDLWIELCQKKFLLNNMSTIERFFSHSKKKNDR
jgi:hypothetical protein